MLRITAEVFSGRPNPSWLATDDQEVRAALRELGKSAALAGAESAAVAGGGLGELRGFRIEVQNDELAMDHGLASSLYLPVGAAGATGAAHDLAERLIGMATQHGVEAAGAAGHGAPGHGHGAAAQTFDHEMLRGFLGHNLGRPSGNTGADSNEAAAAAGRADEAEAAAVQAAVTCMVEYAAYNPAFWNANAFIMQHNNCYNYASNKRTDTFAQPGRGSGHIYTAITCPAVSLAASNDGLHRRFVCFPDTEKPRYLVALVVSPTPGFIDFHWYRKNQEGFWSHKPGGTAVRNVDNSNHVISNPETCNRGPYTQFCGYFYTCRSQRIN